MQISECRLGVLVSLTSSSTISNPKKSRLRVTLICTITLGYPNDCAMVLDDVLVGELLDDYPATEIQAFPRARGEARPKAFMVDLVDASARVSDQTYHYSCSTVTQIGRRTPYFPQLKRLTFLACVRESVVDDAKSPGDNS